MVYVEEFLYRGRDATHEPGQPSIYHVVLAEFVVGPDGKPSQLKTGALTPSQATDAGFPLDRILGDLAASAMMERDQALQVAEVAKTKRDEAEAERAEKVVQCEQLQKELAEAKRIADADAQRLAELSAKAEKDAADLERERSEKIALMNVASQAAVSAQDFAKRVVALESRLEAAQAEIAVLHSASAEANVSKDQPKG